MTPRQTVTMVVSSVVLLGLAGVAVAVLGSLPQAGWAAGRLDGWTAGRLGGWAAGRLGGTQPSRNLACDALGHPHNAHHPHPYPAPWDG